jgi:hypothetical protein
VAITTTRVCDICGREISGRRLEVRAIIIVDEHDGRHHEHGLTDISDEMADSVLSGRAGVAGEYCSSGCAVRAFTALLERSVA